MTRKKNNSPMFMFLLLLIGAGVMFQTVVRKTAGTAPTVLSVTTVQSTPINGLPTSVPQGWSYDANGKLYQPDNIIGWLDGVGGKDNNCSVQGWIKPANQLEAAKDISLAFQIWAFRKGSNGLLDFLPLGGGDANLPSEAAIGGNGHHRFNMVLGGDSNSKRILDGQLWNIMAFYSNRITGKLTPLSGSPKQITCSRPIVSRLTPIGYLDSASCDKNGMLSVSGWANDIKDKDVKLKVYFYVDYTNYGLSSDKILTLDAGQHREDVCHNIKGASCDAAFSGTVPIVTRVSVIGYPATIRVHAIAIDPWSISKEYELSGSPSKEIVCELRR